MAGEFGPRLMADSVSSEYNQESKDKARSMLIKHAVTCLTTKRSSSVCVKRDHVAGVWRQLLASGEANDYFTREEIEEVTKQIGDWELFHDSKVQRKRPSDLRVCYLAGDDPINDLKVFVENGVLCQNVFAIEKDSKTSEKAWNAIKNSHLRNLSLVKENILTFLKEDKYPFDIIYFDTCGSLPAAKQNTLKVIGYVFLYDKLTSPGALITNFSFPPQDTWQENSEISQQLAEERGRINFLVKEYMNYRHCNVFRKDNSPELGNNPEDMKKRTDEDNYGDYVSYQVVDSAYLFIPAQKMLMSGKKHPWGKVFNEKKHFLEEINSYSSPNVEGATNEESTKTKRNQDLMAALKKLKVDEKSTKKKCSEELKALQEKLKAADEVHPSNNLFSDLKRMAETFLEKSENSCCKAWINEIFPDWNKEKSLKKEKMPTMLLTPLLISSPIHIIYFSNIEFVLKGLRPLFNAVDEKKFPFCCDDFQQTCLLAGLLCGQVTCPSFPVMNKLLRLRYTAKERHMFADVFVFDKCQYVYDQFVRVDTACFPIEDLELQIVFRMAVDGLRKHLEGICFEDLFKFCHVASKDMIMEGGVRFPERQEIEDILLKEGQT